MLDMALVCLLQLSNQRKQIRTNFGLDILSKHKGLSCQETER